MTDRPRDQWWLIDFDDRRVWSTSDARDIKDRLSVPAVSGNFEADVAAELRRLRKIEAAAREVIADWRAKGSATWAHENSLRDALAVKEPA